MTKSEEKKKEIKSINYYFYTKNLLYVLTHCYKDQIVVEHVNEQVHSCEWEIVKQESKVLGERSRLRNHEDINCVLTTNTVRQ